MSQEYAPAEWLPSDHHDGWPSGFKPRYIVIHGTAGDATIEAVGTTFNQRGTSTHYAVGQDGRVGQYVSETSAAWGTGVLSAGHDTWWDAAPDGKPNTESFSIEHCKASLDNSAALTSAQQEASFALVKHLCERWGIPRRWADAQGGITGHYSIDPVNRSRCPGTYPWDALFQYLNGGGGAVWTELPDGSAHDDAGNHIGAGLNAARIQRGVTADAYQGGESYVTGCDFSSYVAYKSGEVCLWDGSGPVGRGARRRRPATAAQHRADATATASSAGCARHP